MKRKYSLDKASLRNRLINYKNCHAVVYGMIVCGALMWILSAVWRVKFHYVSVVLAYLGGIFVGLPYFIKWMYWKCPFCRKPLPWWFPRGGVYQYRYRCVYCGKDIELPR